MDIKKNIILISSIALGVITFIGSLLFIIRGRVFTKDQNKVNIDNESKKEYIKNGMISFLFFSILQFGILVYDTIYVYKNKNDLEEDSENILFYTMIGFVTFQFILLLISAFHNQTTNLNNYRLIITDEKNKKKRNSIFYIDLFIFIFQGLVTLLSIHLLMNILFHFKIESLSERLRHILAIVLPIIIFTLFRTIYVKLSSKEKKLKLFGQYTPPTNNTNNSKRTNQPSKPATNNTNNLKRTIQPSKPPTNNTNNSKKPTIQPSKPANNNRNNPIQSKQK